MHEFEGKYYLYYMGNTGNGDPTKKLNMHHRNNQRVGVAVADHPAGPWERFDDPLIDISDDPSALDALMTSNPSICRRDDGTYVLIYKAVGKQYALPNGGPVVHLVATSDAPTGPFKKHKTPVFTVPGHRFPAEDPYIWSQGNSLLAIVKDNEGHFTDAGKSLALFESQDGLQWKLAPSPLVSRIEVNWQDKGLLELHSLERPQLWLDNGEPRVLFCAADDDKKRDHSFNVHIPLRTKD
ncbi:MAG: glycoside hydrolase family protein [Planctomycetota bacterium]